MEVGSTTVPDEAEDVEDLPLVRRRRRRVFSASVDIDEDSEEVYPTHPSSPPPANNVHQQQIGNDFPSEVTFVICFMESSVNILVFLPSVLVAQSNILFMFKSGVASRLRSMMKQ